MPCDSDSFLGCSPGEIASNLAGKAASSAWDTVCQSFADAAITLLKGFAKTFVAFPNVDLSSGGVRSVYGLSLGISALVASMLLLFQIARTAITHDGAGLAHGLVGIGKTALAFMTTLTVAGTGLVAADQLTVFVINQSFGSNQGLEDKLAGIFSWAPKTAASLLLILALIGILLVTVLWFELLLSNAAVAVLIATSPIAAAGMVSEATRDWWPKLVSATIRLIVLKPTIALVFAVGFGVMGNSQSEDIGTMLAGMLILLLAALAWPAIARFFTFAAAHTGGGTGLAAVLGFAAGQMNGGGGSGGPPVGVEPDQFGQVAEGRTMASFASKGGGQIAGSGGSAQAGAAGAGGGGAGAAAGAAGAAGAVAVVPMVLAKGLDMAQRAANSLVGRMEQTAGHAGLPGASPFAYPAGYNRGVPPRAPAPAEPGAPPVESDEPGTSMAPAAVPEAAPDGGTHPAPPVEPVSSAQQPVPALRSPESSPNVPTAPSGSAPTAPSSTPVEQEKGPKP